MKASENGYIEIVKILIKHKEIDLNAKDISRFYLLFILIFKCFKIIYQFFDKFLKQQL